MIGFISKKRTTTKKKKKHPKINSTAPLLGLGVVAVGVLGGPVPQVAACVVKRKL